MAVNVINGKAFEYMCLNCLRTKLEIEGKAVAVVEDKAFHNALAAYERIPRDDQVKLYKAAVTAMKLFVPLEPRFLGGPGTLSMSIAPDSAAVGVDGDVRDVLCVRHEDDWEIGISCKHNHEALRHPRITEGKDFGTDWVGTRCSHQFMEAISPVTDSLREYGENETPWRTIENKQDRYYVPILQAYLDEIRRMCAADPSIPEKLLSYFFGAHDFYKVIMKANARTTTIIGFNMHGTLGSPCGKTKAMTKVPVIKMPTKLYNASFKDGSKTTIILTFDGGWAVSMRLHNKDSIARPTSLAWDVNLVGFPPSTYVNTHSWDE